VKIGILMGQPKEVYGMDGEGRALKCGVRWGGGGDVGDLVCCGFVMLLGRGGVWWGVEWVVLKGREEGGGVGVVGGVRLWVVLWSH